jgi:hypothetical protein
VTPAPEKHRRANSTSFKGMGASGDLYPNPALFTGISPPSGNLLVLLLNIVSRRGASNSTDKPFQPPIS